MTRPPTPTLTRYPRLLLERRARRSIGKPDSATSVCVKPKAQPSRFRILQGVGSELVKLLESPSHPRGWIAAAVMRNSAI